MVSRGCLCNSDSIPCSNQLVRYHLIAFVWVLLLQSRLFLRRLWKRNAKGCHSWWKLVLLNLLNRERCVCDWVCFLNLNIWTGLCHFVHNAPMGFLALLSHVFDIMHCIPFLVPFLPWNNSVSQSFKNFMSNFILFQGVLSNDHRFWIFDLLCLFGALLAKRNRKGWTASNKLRSCCSKLSSIVKLQNIFSPEWKYPVDPISDCCHQYKHTN